MSVCASVYIHIYKCVCLVRPPGVYLVVCPLISHVLFALKFLRLIGQWRGTKRGRGGGVAAATNAH